MVAVVFALALALPPPPAASANAGDGLAFDCRDARFRWSHGRPKINLRHLFCGEVDDGHPKGLHSTRLAATWTVVRRIERRQEEGGGIYSTIAVFRGGRRKFSTFFPDRCTAEQIVQSIEYAASNPKRSHKQWGKIGLSGPELDSIRDHNRADHETFCLDNENKPFEIRLGVLADGRINTAFPN